MLFERFISEERNEPPDIDVDFEHQRREEVIQYIYAKYGRERARRSQLPSRSTGRAARSESARRSASIRHRRPGSKGINGSMRVRTCSSVSRKAASTRKRRSISNGRRSPQLLGFPRHLSQHSGGFVIARGKLSRLVPIENAAMPDRKVIQWDKDDLEALGMLKIDMLALGMLRRSADVRLVADQRVKRSSCRNPARRSGNIRNDLSADTVGVFQIESRAQMRMLPRLRPREFYDLVIEVAIVRPGPVQGGMVHPYLRRRQGPEAVSFPSAALRRRSTHTWRADFQEQVMQVAMVAAGFSAGEADQLRRAMAAWKRKGGLHQYYDRIVNGMLERGYDRSSPRRSCADRRLR